MNIFKNFFKGRGEPKDAVSIEVKALDDLSCLHFSNREIQLEAISPDRYKGLTFLVADDNMDQLHVLGSFLQGRGAEVDFAENGQLAVQLFFAAPHRYQIIIMDIQMPLMSGDEAAKQIRSSQLQGAQSIPLIGISGNMAPSDQTGCIFNYFLRKPFRMEQLAYSIQCIQENIR